MGDISLIKLAPCARLAKPDITRISMQGLALSPVKQRA